MVARIAAALALATLACAATGPAPRVEPSGFLGDYAQLQPGRSDQAQLVFIDPEADFSVYDKVLIDPVTIWLGGEDAMADLTGADLQRLAAYLETALRSQMAQEFALVEEPTPGAMRIRAAITEAVGSRVVLDIASTVLFPISVAKKLATGTHAFVGGAAIEVEVLDARTGRRLAAAVDARAGSKRLRGATDTWSDVEAAFDYWAELIRMRLGTFRDFDAALRDETG